VGVRSCVEGALKCIVVASSCAVSSERRFMSELP